MAKSSSTTRQQKPKRWAPKTRSGCFTCRKHRVKCDEVKPICHRCTRLDRFCIYRNSESETRDKGTNVLRGRSNQISRDVSARSTTCEEALHLHTYSRAIAPWLATYSQAEFFEQVLPLWSSQYQAIRHALVAVAMAGEEFYLGKDVKYHRRVWHYDQALKHMYMPQTSVDVIMLACVVLWLHDNIVDDTRAAVLHVKGFVRMLLAYERKNTPAGIGKNLDCTIWRGLSHWGQRTQHQIDTRLSKDAVVTVREKLQDPRLGRLSQNPTSCTADALLFITSVVWACDEHADTNDTIPPITFEELRSFLERWYATALQDINLRLDDRAILKCHYTLMGLTIRAQERLSAGDSSCLIDDHEGLQIFEDVLTLLESISVEYLVQQPGSRDLILPIIPVALEAERIAPSVTHKLRIEKFLQSTKRVESFWSTSVIADAIKASVTACT